MPSTVSVIIHPSRIYCEGLRSLLASTSFLPASIASHPSQLKDDLLSPGDTLLAILGAQDGVDLAAPIREIVGRFPAARIVVIGDGHATATVRDAIRAGAASFLDEAMSTVCLVKALDLVAAGEPFIPVAVLKALLGNEQAPPVPAEVSPADQDETEAAAVEAATEHHNDKLGANSPRLSSREAAILDSLVKGAPNKVIAHQLNIAEATVKVHVKAILRKIRVKNRTQAAVWAMSRAQPATTESTQPEFPKRAVQNGSYEGAEDVSAHH